MSIKSRSIVFATFISNCLVVGLLVASLTTDYWIHAVGNRHNAPSSIGRVHFGLISGMKSLNVAYGWRNETINVPTLIRDEPNTMNFLLWVGAALGTGFGLFSSAVAAVASVLKSASAEPKKAVVVLLLVSNFASAISTMLAFICWLLQFYQYLTHNVFSLQDQQQHWYSKDNAWLGHSFYFVVVGCIIACINVILIITVINLERREKRIDPPCDEEAQGSIMLY